MIALRAEIWPSGGRTAGIWRSSLERFVYPHLAAKRVNETTTADVMRVLLPIWNEKRATAIKLKSRVSGAMSGPSRRATGLTTPPAASPRGSSSKPSPCSSPCVRLKPPTEQETMTRDSVLGQEICSVFGGVRFECWGFEVGLQGPCLVERLVGADGVVVGGERCHVVGEVDAAGDVVAVEVFVFQRADPAFDDAVGPRRAMARSTQYSMRRRPRSVAAVSMALCRAPMRSVAPLVAVRSARRAATAHPRPLCRDKHTRTI